MKLTMELPEGDHKVMGMSRLENRRFWICEDEFNSRCFGLMNFSIIFTSLLFTIQLFLVSELFEVDLFYYIAFQTINVLNTNFYFWNFFHCIYMVSLLIIQCMWFLSTKFDNLLRKVQRLSVPKSKPLNNRKLAMLIVEFNKVQTELMETNDFFKNYLGDCQLPTRWQSSKY